VEKFTRLTAVAAPLLRINVDTDAIIPSREMKKVGKTGLAGGLFAGWRYLAPGSRDEDPAFVLNQPAYRAARILLTGLNFGCGSSREHAVWALHEWGIRCVIAPSYGAIFYGNCVRNGILPVVLDNARIEALAAEVGRDPARPVTVDLVECRITAPDGSTVPFEVPPGDREVLLEGLDGIAVTLKRGAAIDDFAATDRTRRPWIYLVRTDAARG
jgi:3-isopropylmalate/(R)-2-methylmalate dehydratase small subunit